MKNLITISGLLLLVLTFTTGCVSRSVPANQILTKSFGDFTFPQDSEIHGLTIQKTQIGKTNITLVRIEKYIGKNDAGVIASSAQGQAMILANTIQATGGAVGNAMAAYQKSMIGSPPTTPQPQGPPSP